MSIQVGGYFVTDSHLSNLVTARISGMLNI